jgi:hypothetical protein
MAGGSLHPVQPVGRQDKDHDIFVVEAVRDVQELAQVVVGELGVLPG